MHTGRAAAEEPLGTTAAVEPSEHRQFNSSRTFPTGRPRNPAGHRRSWKVRFKVRSAATKEPLTDWGMETLAEEGKAPQLGKLLFFPTSQCILVSRRALYESVGKVSVQHGPMTAWGL